jgi:hypothetical protein
MSCRPVGPWSLCLESLRRTRLLELFVLDDAHDLLAAMAVDVATTSALPSAPSDMDIAHQSTSPASAPTLPPSRALKSTPTLIDNNPRSRSLDVSHTSSMATDLVRPLSPPKAETERLLNQASSSRKGSPAESIESKLSRASSAPGHDALRKPKPKQEPAKAATVAGFELGDGTGASNASESGSGSGGKREMIEVLRQLAQKEDSTPGRSKLVSGVKTGTTASSTGG